MKTIGLIGGTGWVSTAEYYRLINEGINKKLGGLEFARCILYSMNYAEAYKLQKQDPEVIFNYLDGLAQKLKSVGAECIALCANTLHLFYDRLDESVGLPIIHIAQATADEIRRNNMSKVGLLGTSITMESDFYKGVLKKNEIDTIVPDKTDRDYINEIIFTELFQLDFKTETRRKFIDIIEQLHTKGAEGIVLGCTEIPLLIQQDHSAVKLFNTLELHADAIVNFSIS